MAVGHMFKKSQAKVIDRLLPVPRVGPLVPLPHQPSPPPTFPSHPHPPAAIANGQSLF